MIFGQIFLFLKKQNRKIENQTKLRADNVSERLYWYLFTSLYLRW